MTGVAPESSVAHTEKIISCDEQHAKLKQSNGWETEQSAVLEMPALFNTPPAALG